jgi:hypothetical protein
LGLSATYGPSYAFSFSVLEITFKKFSALPSLFSTSFSSSSPSPSFFLYFSCPTIWISAIVSKSNHFAKTSDFWTFENSPLRTPGPQTILIMLTAPGCH